MAAFFWNHKLFSLLIICGLVYWFSNPSHKFGYAGKSLVIYNRVPISFFDVYITPDGSIKPEMNLTDPQAQTDWVNDILQTPHEDELLLIVGTGIAKTSFHLKDSLITKLDFQKIRVTQVPTLEAVRLYNASVDANKPTAIILVMRQ
jgi:hypothetical protein